MNNKKEFNRLSIIYSIVVVSLSVIFFLFHADLNYNRFNFLWFYNISIFLLNLAYYYLLQRIVRVIKYPNITMLSAFNNSGGFALGIIILLLLGISRIQPAMLIVFAPIYIALPVWLGHIFWIARTDN